MDQARARARCPARSRAGSRRGAAVMTAASPQASALLFDSAAGPHLFVTDRSRVYGLERGAADELAHRLAAAGSAAEADALIAALTGVEQPRVMEQASVQPPPLRTLSLNLAQACNMACGYCYADEGRFGGRARSMPPEVARASVDRLLAESAPGEDLVLGFIGGEPLLNRRVLRATVDYAVQAAQGAGRRMRFSLTTNATLVDAEDAAFLHEHGFHVSVSLDGAQPGNDLLRPMRDGSGSYRRVLEALETMQRHGRPRHLAARVTVTPRSGELLPILQHHIGLGFDSVGFAAVLTSPDPSLAFDATDFDGFTRQMVACGRQALQELSAGRCFPFGNFETAMQEIHRGSHRPYPCGAGAGYLSVGASGGMYACHRVIDEPAWAMGDVRTGTDAARRARHLTLHQVDRQQPCGSCWARYLCGGGCHHEVQRRGRIACDYIRDWLAFCLSAYTELAAARPDYFSAARQ
ncbi:MAG: radical SAM protein, partial [Aquabacterium sp.]